MRWALFMCGVLLTGWVQAQTEQCRFLEHFALLERGLAEGQPCHALYQACLKHVVRPDDPIPRTRCMETVRCGTRFWVAAPGDVPATGNLERFRQGCEPE